MRVVQSGGKPVAAGPALAEASAVPVDPDEHLWRSLDQMKRDLPAVTHDRAQEICFTLYQQNPLGHRMTELIRDYVVGDGILWDALHPGVAEVVEELWEDGINDLEVRSEDFALELGLYGELIPEVFAGPISGVVRLGYIDPSQVKKVSPLEGNPLVLDKVWIRRKGFGHAGEPLDIVRDRGQGRLEGDTFFFRVNAVSNATRGWPDLLHIADWLDAFDQMLWEVAERSRLARTFIWDVELPGQDQPQVDAWVRRYGSPPKSGTVRAHNDKEKWTAVAPNLGSFETAAEAETLMKHLAGSFGVPVHWLSSAEDVNRATALEMGQPTVRRLGRRQKAFLRVLRHIVRYTLEQAELSGALRTQDGLLPVMREGRKTDELRKPWKLVRFHAPAIERRDTFRAGALFSQTVSALKIAEEAGWFGPQTSRQAVAAVLKHIGVEYEPQTDAERKPAVRQANDDELAELEGSAA